MSFKRIFAAVIVLIATLGTATSASGSTAAPVPEIKWVERPCFDWIVPFDDELPCGEAFHNSKALAVGAGRDTIPHVPRP